jgi:hypothetical protein
LFVGKNKQNKGKHIMTQKQRTLEMKNFIINAIVLLSLAISFGYLFAIALTQTN